MNQKKILITGCAGQVGSSIQSALTGHPTYRAIATTRSEFNLTDEVGMRRFFHEAQPDLLINAAAYTAVDQAEEERELAFQINGKACGVMAELCHEADIPIIHFSTDYLYDNPCNRPLREDDHLMPASVYAQSKKDGEDRIRKQHAAHFIIRTSWVYDAYGKNFVNTMLSLAKKHDRLTVVDDQIGSPTYAPDLATLCLHLAGRLLDQKIEDASFGTYNFSDEGVCSWYDFAMAIFDIAQVDIQVDPVSSSAFPRPARRPSYSVLSKEKIRSLLPEFRIPHWRDSLATCLLARSS